MEISCKPQSFHSPPDNCGKTCRQFKGIRLRKWGKWGAETRIPKTRTKIWLGSYDTAEQAAHAYDAGIYCLRGPKAEFNFPNSIPAIPSASSLSRQQIRLAAAKYALDQIPSTEEDVSPLGWSDISETAASSEGHVVYEEQQPEPTLTFGDSDGNEWLNLERFPSPDATATAELMASTTALWESLMFGDLNGINGCI